LEFLRSIITFAGVLVVLVVVHELGHFLTAKRAGVKVLEFGIGYPPKLWGIKRGETEYTINLLPLGGFVRMVGEEDPEDPRSLAAQSIPWRLVILSAGVVMNLLLAIVLLSASAMIPHTEQVSQVVIHGVRAGSPAELAGVKVDDVVLSVDGREIRNMPDLSYNVNLHLGQQISMLLQREGKNFEVQLTPRVAPPTGEGATGIEIGTANPIWQARKDAGITTETLAQRLDVPVDTVKTWESFGAQAVGKTKADEDLAKEQGITTDALRDSQLAKLSQVLNVSPDQLQQSYIKEEQVSISPLAAIPMGIQRSFEMVVLTKNDFASMIAKHSAPQVAGPVGIAQLSGQVADQASRTGPSVLLDFAALLSINLAVLNVLPIPMLDGGRILFVVIEAVRGGRRISPDKEKYAHLVGAALLFTLIIAVTFNDIFRLASGESLFR